ncbi:MAG: hypothetical protein E6R04_06015 [Spirochaetes bacterium]|nr:MAG: hypothetical protein E6R04_06015 [Spirochaetota bacterium]
MTTYLEMCSNRVAALKAALVDIEEADAWIDAGYCPQPLLRTLLNTHRSKQEQALKEALEFEEFARSQENEP